ncbi:alpha/beta fold hydrolase [soil metagenome]
MRATTTPPGIVDSSIEALVGLHDATVRGATDYVAQALTRRASPLTLGLDVLDWVRTMTERRPPRWATEHRVLAEWPIARLRDFSTGEPGESGGSVPVLFLPPQAGHDSCIVDYDPTQSQVGTALAAGLTRVLSLDWVGATQATKDSSIEEYVAVVAEAIALVGGRVHLVGDCQGGWLAVIYAALYPETVETLTIAGAPIDFHAGEPLIHDWMGVLSPEKDLEFYRTMVRSNDGILPGEFLLAGFIAMQPHSELDRQLQLLAHLHEPEHVARYRTFDAWFHHCQPIPGAFYLWIVEHLFQDNELIAGTLQVGDRVVDLGQITCPLNLLAGETDHITPPPQVYALADHAGTDPAEVSTNETTGGHLGLFMGREALQDHWAPLFATLAARDAPSSD